MSAVTFSDKAIATKSIDSSTCIMYHNVWPRAHFVVNMGTNLFLICSCTLVYGFLCLCKVSPSYITWFVRYAC